MQRCRVDIGHYSQGMPTSADSTLVTHRLGFQVPLDLRTTMASSILCVGGTPMLPGFIPRLHAELIRTLSAVPSPQRQQTRPGRPPPPPYDRYASLRPLTKYIAILNDP